MPRLTMPTRVRGHSPTHTRAHPRPGARGEAGTRWERLLQELRRPRLQLVLKSSLAAALAWQVASAVPGPLGDYAYYAPLGAISVIYPAVTDSLQEAARAVVAIALGIAVAMTIQWVAWPNAVTVGLVVAAGIALGGWAWLGEQRTWVPVVGLFVLVLGGAHTETYAAGYLGQVALGAVLGLAVNLVVLPPLSLYDVRRSVAQVRSRVGDELRSMAELLEQSRSQETAPDARDWRRELDVLESSREQMRAAARQADRAAQKNPRTRRWADTLESARRTPLSLEQVVHMVEEVGLVMSEERRPHLARCTDLAGPVVDGLRVLAEIVESSPVPGPLSARGTEAMDRVTAEYDRTTFPDRDSRLAASVVVLTMTRCFAVLTDGSPPVGRRSS
jgi:uncharacterized membrane protein YgaE (UPF0421/DUF939 family)